MDVFNAKEFSRRYSHCYAPILLKKTKEVIPAYFSDIVFDETQQDIAQAYVSIPSSSSRDRVQAITGSSAKEQKAVFPVNQFKVLENPSPRVFDFEGISISYTRNPQRQWLRGISRNNSSLYSPVEHMMNTLHPRGVIKDLSFSLRLLQNLLHPDYAKTFRQALFEIKEFGLVSRCIDSKYFVSLFPNNEKEYVLFRTETPIAYYSERNDSFSLINQLYVQELSDFCRRNNLHSWIR